MGGTPISHRQELRKAADSERSERVCGVRAERRGNKQFCEEKKEGNAMAGLVNIGFGNLVNAQKVAAVVNPDAAPVKRLVQSAKEQQKVIDATQGRRTKSVIVLETEQIILSAVQPDTIARRFAATQLTEQEMRGEEQ